MGPVTPLIATARALRRLRSDVTFVWFGTPDGPERALVEKEGIPFFAIPVAKLPRYPSIHWLTFPFDAHHAKRVARNVLMETKPDVVVSAGGFTAVPVMREARTQGIPCAIHQLDAVPGLANKAVAKLCQSVTTSFAYENPPFGPHVNSEQIPTPVFFKREELPERGAALASFGLSSARPCVLIVGGGTGAQAINLAIFVELERLLERAQIIHSTGAGKVGKLVPRPGYYFTEQFDLSAMQRAYAAADVIVSRAGMGALSELSELGKPSIIIPIPNNQQEVNAQHFSRVPGVTVFDQVSIDYMSRLREAIFETLQHPSTDSRGMRGVLPTDDGTALAKRVMALVE